MSLDTVAKEMNKLKSVAEYFAEGDAIDIRSMPQRTVQTEYYVDGWIPFACDGGGSYLAVDTVPDSDGTIAQVIIVGNTDTYFVVAESIGAFVEFLKTKYEMNKMNERFYSDQKSVVDRSLTPWLEDKYCKAGRASA